MSTHINMFTHTHTHTHTYIYFTKYNKSKNGINNN